MMLGTPVKRLTASGGLLTVQAQYATFWIQAAFSRQRVIMKQLDMVSLWTLG